MNILSKKEHKLIGDIICKQLKFSKWPSFLFSGENEHELIATCVGEHVEENIFVSFKTYIWIYDFETNWNS